MIAAFSSRSRAIAILAVISGADGWVAIETYGQAKQEWLTTFLSLSNGIPSHDTFARVFARIEHSYYKSSESGHGRIEIRHYYSVPLSVLTGLSQQDVWTGLASIGMVGE